MNESFRSQNRAALFHPAVTILIGDIANGDVLKIREQSLDVHFPAFDGAGAEGVLVGIQPHFPGLGEGQFGIR
ncbi:MAG TPA: hypothetical protein VMR33_19070 [Candidatus Baltobacteraceae bacterium]|nr:hypothetical protein [Candidatus Baltobacteraceae bacterium]